MKGFLNPGPALLAKIGSIAVHAEEMLSSDSHAFDRIAIENLLKDEEVIEWLKAMDMASMVPRKRRAAAGATGSGVGH